MLQILAWAWRLILRLIGIQGGTRDDKVSYDIGRIDQNFQNLRGELDKVSHLVQTLEKDREAKFGQLTTQLRNMGEQTVALTDSTRTLREALSSPQTRGQWGERMAEDILQLIGFKEGINYQKQMTVQGGGARPDFTFLLPQNLKLNMDVKFPLANYLKYLETESETDRVSFKNHFLRDVRTKIDEVSSRQYVDPEQGTVDYVLLFIPNESVYGFIHESDSQLLDMALGKKVIWCSPLTLYAVLAVVRQAVENFALRQTSNEIISLISAFDKQWETFTKSLDTLGDRIARAQKAFDDVNGTRRRALERPLRQIEELRKERQLPVAEEYNKVLATSSDYEDLSVLSVFDPSTDGVGDEKER